MMLWILPDTNPWLQYLVQFGIAADPAVSYPPPGPASSNSLMTQQDGSEGPSRTSLIRVESAISYFFPKSHASSILL
jgi:hypothetical protein